MNGAAAAKFVPAGLVGGSERAHLRGLGAECQKGTSRHPHDERLLRLVSVAERVEWLATGGRVEVRHAAGRRATAL